MDKKQIKNITDYHFRKFKKQFNQIITRFDPETIHQFRVEYKKLRAFLRMLSLQGKSGKIKIPGKLKRMYRCAGSIRDLQFLEKRFKIALKQPDKDLQNCIRHIQIEGIRMKTLFSKIADGKMITITKKKVDKALPGNCSKNTFKVFAEKKLSEINAVISSQTFPDKQIHSIRKNLKDLFYNLSIFKETCKHSFPVSKWNKDTVNSIEKLLVDLGDFQDNCTAIDLVKRHCTADMNSKAGNKIKQLDKGWKLEKRRQKNILVKKLKEFAAL